MIHVATITTPANTSIDYPKRSIMPIIKGVVYKIEIYFPPGSAGLVGVRVFDSLHQLYPTTNDEWFYGDNVTVQFEDREYVMSETNELQVLTYNTDDTYEHRTQVRIGILSAPEFVASFMFYDSMQQLLQELNTITVNLSVVVDNLAKFRTTSLSDLVEER